MASHSDELVASDVDGHLLREYDDVFQLRPSIFTRHDIKGSGASIKLKHMPADSEATIIMITEEKMGNEKTKVLHLESVEGVFFKFELPENVRVAKSRDSKLDEKGD